MNLRKEAENYVLRMLYLAPFYVVKSLHDGTTLLRYTKTGFTISPRDDHPRAYLDAKEWIEKYIAMTPLDDKSVTTPISEIILN